MLKPAQRNPAVLGGSTMGERIESVRRYVDVSKTELGKLVGVSFPAVSAWLTDKSVPQSHRLRMLAYRCQVSRNWIETGRGDPLELDVDEDPEPQSRESGIGSEGDESLYPAYLDFLKTDDARNATDDELAWLRSIRFVDGLEPEDDRVYATLLNLHRHYTQPTASAERKRA